MQGGGDLPANMVALVSSLPSSSKQILDASKHHTAHRAHFVIATDPGTSNPNTADPPIHQVEHFREQGSRQWCHAGEHVNKWWLR